MVPINGEWTRFSDLQDALNHYRLWGLIPEKSKALRPVMVTDGYFGVPEPCTVVGYQGDNWAVIELSDGYHAIHGEYLAELQPVPHQRLPRGTSFVEILSKYVVIDIETTGFSHHHDRIIEIAAATYEYGRQVDVFQTLVNPGMLLPSDIVRLTGITQSDVDQAPSLDAIMPEFLSYIGSLPLLGHNAVSFDIPFLSAQMQIEFKNPILDTLPMAQKAFDLLPRYKLEYLKTVLGLSNAASHRALADVETTNALLWACLSPRRYESKVWRAAPSVECETATTQHTNRNVYVHGTPRTFERVNIKSITPTCTSVNKSHPLCNKVIVFTGSLSIPREEAMQLAVDCGAVLKSDVSRKTNYLVVGTQDKTLVGADGMSKKEETASNLNLSGKANIEVISENEFLEMVHTKIQSQDLEQLDFFSPTLTEDQVYNLLLDSLSSVISQNNVSHDKLIRKDGKAYSSVWYDTQMAFRICCRDNHHYFSVSNLYTSNAPTELHKYVTKDGRYDGFTNFEFVPDTDGVMRFSTFLSSTLDMAIDSIAKEFDCCSRFEECSNVMHCTNPNVAIATGCGYRKIMKKGRIFYGKNRNID